jgi:hypothetical protein
MDFERAFWNSPAFYGVAPGVLGSLARKDVQLIREAASALK